MATKKEEEKNEPAKETPSKTSGSAPTNKVPPVPGHGGNTRWTANLFFQGGLTKRPRLDELGNGRNVNVIGVTDTTDEQLAEMILNRAGLATHHKYNDLVVLFADALKDIDNPTEWLNPNYGKDFKETPFRHTTTDTTAPGKG